MPSIAGMRDWLQQIGHSESDLDKLKIIHIAGTKGKGSTASFVESILRAHGSRTGHPRKTGLYTSPHLITPEERIRINFEPINRTLFAEYFFEIYDRLPQLRAAYNATKPVVERGPRYLQIFCLLAFHVFIREEVDVAVFETHAGGEYDATNVIQCPTVTAITTLGMDHVAMLGPTIEDIAWHKGGIFKEGAIALSAVQELSAAAVLRDRARSKGEGLKIVEDDARLPLNEAKLNPNVQKQNASLAVAAADSWLASRGKSPLATEDVHLGIRQWSWPGRFQIVQRDNNTFYLDSAHNAMSVNLAAEWYAGHLSRSRASVVVFAHVNELRDRESLLDHLLDALKRFETGLGTVHFVFTTYARAKDESAGQTDPPGYMDQLSRMAHGALPQISTTFEPTVETAVQAAESFGRTPGGAQILITGSQHLVGPALEILQRR